ncbi:hypothetical protein HJG60_008992 [Phyllostomus discolor]|uniref:Uncharacterized protein n=1 Tax=Phyllostomus discolor TaxID=89673 RepID=A0A833YPH7_9CHIR|nr:hypothetical protein HJG60_008992 [Phyllostomus discolor]
MQNQRHHVRFFVIKHRCPKISPPVASRVRHTGGDTQEIRPQSLLLCRHVSPDPTVSKVSCWSAPDKLPLLLPQRPADCLCSSVLGLSILFVDLSTLSSAPHCLNYCSYRVSPESGNVSHPTLLLFFL